MKGGFGTGLICLLCLFAVMALAGMEPSFAWTVASGSDSRTVEIFLEDEYDYCMELDIP